MSPVKLTDLSLDQKRALARRLLRAEDGKADALVPLSKGQESLWFVHQLAPESPAYNFLHVSRVATGLDLPAFRRAAQSLVDRHPALRTTFAAIDRRPFQRVHERLTLPVEVVDASGWARQAAFEACRAESSRPFDLRRGPCMRMHLYMGGPDGDLLALSGHHIIADLWSMGLIARDLRRAYEAERSGRRLAPPDAKATYADYVRYQANWVDGPEGRAAWAFWKRKLAGEFPVLNLPTDRTRPPVQTYRGDARTWPLDPSLVDRLRALGRSERTTLFAVILAAFQVLLARYTGLRDLLVGTATAGRGRPEWEGVVGYFLNQVPLRADLAGDPTFLKVVRRARVEVLEALEHQGLPLGLLVERLQPARDPSRPPLFQAMFIWDKEGEPAVDEPDPAGDSLRLETLFMEQRGAPFDLTLIVFETGPNLSASLRYNADLFEPATIARMAGHLETLLGAIADDPSRPISALPILTAEEHRLVGATDRVADPDGRPLHHRIGDQVRRDPGAPAVLFQGHTLSHGDLDRRSNRIAWHLRALGVGPGRLVGICLPRSPDLIAAILGTWKAGAGYLPIDPTYPPARIARMIDEARPAVILTLDDLAGPWANADPTIVRLDADREAIASRPDSDPGVAVGLEDLAYVIFTSGSTGEPKGVIVRHRGLANLAEAQVAAFGFGPADRVLQFASISFDASVFEIAMALRVGAALVLATPSTVLPGPGLVGLLRDQGVTVATLPPSILAALPIEPLPDLGTIVVAGEACPADLVTTWAPGRRFFNAYGPTEATVWSSLARCEPGGRAPTIGRTIANTRHYVLDADMQPVPIGVSGELYIGGPGVAAGYLNRPELTVEAFVPNPFEAEDGGVLYRTGDLARLRDDGEIEYLGRLDHQVKLRGYRIEPGEVEAALRSQPEVREAVVIARVEGGGRLVAYVVPADLGAFPAALAEVRARLRDRLPHYMLPSAIVPLAALPLSSNGKVDRDRLPDPEAAEALELRETTAPRTPEEALLAEAWARVLKVRPVGIHDNFFDLGGASIQTLEVVALAAEVGLTITPELLFRHQTVAELAAACILQAPSEKSDSVPSRERARTIETHVPSTTSPARVAIESLGVYLPPKAVSTAEVVRGCKVGLEFPLERMTGIRNRRMAGDSEFSFDLAVRAVEDCLSRSVYGPEEIDLLICGNISRCDGPDARFAFEPSTAARLVNRFGFENAIAFDVSNACAGTFTAIAIAEAFLLNGRARRALVVSGEYITHLTRTAQLEIDGFLDPRLACLTLGDAGAALILERARTEGVGFEALSMFTLGKYSDLCVAKGTDQPHGGAIMWTDPVRASAVTVQQAVGHAIRTLEARDWPVGSLERIFMHQTSETTLDGAVRAIDEAIGPEASSRGKAVFNVAERGNTASTTHWVALMDQVRAGAFRAGDRVLFGISGSGQTVGTSLYTLDDLADRIRSDRKPGPRPTPEAMPATAARGRVRIEGLGLAGPIGSGPADSSALIRQAAESCLADSGLDRSGIGLIIHAGVYRTEFLSEPALAAIAAGDLGINHEPEAPGAGSTLAFDLANGAAGFLDACRVASEWILAGKASTALVVASEVENNAGPDRKLGLAEMGSALLLSRSIDDDGEGFVGFHDRTFPAHLDDLSTYTARRDGRTEIVRERSGAFESHLLDALDKAARELLTREGIASDRIAVAIAPRPSDSFADRLAEALGIDVDRFAPVGEVEGDPFTSAVPLGFRAVRETGRVKPGDLALILAGGSGIHVSAALYQF